MTSIIFPIGVALFVGGIIALGWSYLSGAESVMTPDQCDRIADAYVVVRELKRAAYNDKTDWESAEINHWRKLAAKKRKA